jgi:hypothetical protein
VVVEGAVTAAAVDRVLSSQRRLLEFSLISGISTVHVICHMHRVRKDCPYYGSAYYFFACFFLASSQLLWCYILA